MHAVTLLSLLVMAIVLRSVYGNYAILFVINWHAQLDSGSMEEEFGDLWYTIRYLYCSRKIRNEIKKSVGQVSP